MTQVQLPTPGRFARVVVGWDVSTQSFEAACYRHTDEAGEALVTQLEYVPQLPDLEHALMALGVELPPVIVRYLSAARATNAEERERLDPELARLRRS
jgi:hypothetical protein